MKYWNVTLQRTPAMKLERKIAKMLRVAKKERRLIPYEEVGKAVGMLPRHKSIATALGNLVWEDLRRGRPIRSSLVVRKGSSAPGPGYFELLESLGVTIPTDPTDLRTFVQDRQEEVFAY